jgi:hypothetical protein
LQQFFFGGACSDLCDLKFAVNQKNWLLLGALNANFGAARSIHGSGILLALLLVFFFLNLT